MSINKLIEKMQSKTTIGSEIIENSKFFEDPDFIKVDVPMLNVALSGSVDKGLAHGLIQIAGPSKHFKSKYAILMAKAFLDHYKDGLVIFYDNEFGSPLDYFKSFDIDCSRVLHCPFTSIETLKFDVVAQLEALTPKDNVMFLIDSIGNAASKKEVDDAIEQKSVGDMTRAKAIKSLFRIVTPYLNINRIPMVAVNHTYESQGKFSKQIVSGGTGGYYSSNGIWLVSRVQNKDGGELQGFDFKIKIEKSRYVKEGAVIPISVSYDNGISKWSGLFDVAVHLGYIKSAKKGWFVAHDEDGNPMFDKKSWRRAETGCSKFWDAIFNSTKIKEKIEKMYSLPKVKMIDTGDVAEIDQAFAETEEELEEEEYNEESTSD